LPSNFFPAPPSTFPPSISARYWTRFFNFHNPPVPVLPNPPLFGDMYLRKASVPSRFLTRKPHTPFFTPPPAVRAIMVLSCGPLSTVIATCCTVFFPPSFLSSPFFFQLKLALFFVLRFRCTYPCPNPTSVTQTLFAIFFPQKTDGVHCGPTGHVSPSLFLNSPTSPPLFFLES